MDRLTTDPTLLRTRLSDVIARDGWRVVAERFKLTVPELRAITRGEQPLTRAMNDALGSAPQ